MLEEDLIEGAKDGDKEAFMEIVNIYKKKIVNLCYSYTNDYYEAEDLSQEVFVSLYKSLKNFRFESSLSTYIYKITVSKCIDYKRKNKIKNFFGSFLNAPEKSYQEDVVEKDYIRECINSLPENLKTPLVLYYYIGLSQKEIAEVMSISPKNVEGRIYRAKKKLKEEFEKEAEGFERKYGLYR